mmetsp:Transcript_3517/g.7309  ORF Transcript_3517/g.7309 Transcript_3517/m.7309 type:complete len:117 (-) Transcript_3517:2917-3267(-)
MRDSWRSQYSFLPALYFSAFSRGVVVGLLIPILYHYTLRLLLPSPRQLKSLNIWTLREVLKRDMRAQHLKDDDDFDPPQHCGIFSSLCCSLLFAASEGALVTIVPIMLIASACEDL